MKLARFSSLMLVGLAACSEAPNEGAAGTESTITIESTTQALVAGIDLTGTGGTDVWNTTTRCDQPIRFNTRVRNNGSVASGPFTVKYFLSTDGVISASDFALSCDWAVPGLAAGTTVIAYGRSCSFASPDGGPPQLPTPGEYRILGRVDALQQVAESNETNNVISSGIVRYGGDLVAGTLTAIKNGSHLEVTWPFTETQCTPTTRPPTQRVVLSTDQTFDAGDLTLISGPYSGAMTGSGAVTGSVFLGNFPSGTYWVIGKLDAYDNMFEINESNNVAIGANQIVIP